MTRAESTTTRRVLLLADVNRDGVLDDDESNDGTWTAERGAIFAPNLDDDDGDGVRDAYDDEVNGAADIADMTRLVAKRVSGLTYNDTVRVRLTVMRTRAVDIGARLFFRPAGSSGLPDLLLDATADTSSTTISPDLIGSRDLELFLDTRYGRHVGFDGYVEVRLAVEREDGTVEEAHAMLRGAPILYSHSMQPGVRVFVLDSPYYGYDVLPSEMRFSMPRSIDLFDSYTYGHFDIWTQDFMQTGYTQKPGIGAPTISLTHTKLTRYDGVDGYLDGFLDEYIDGSHGYTYPRARFETTGNFGGNLEVIPPHEHNGLAYPYGRLLIGSAMQPEQTQFINAQGLQGPAIEIDTSWLWIGHVDELVHFVPNRYAGSKDRKWVVIINSPSLGLELLQDANDRGHGDAFLINEAKRYAPDDSVESWLEDSHNLHASQLVQVRIDTIKEKLINEVGLSVDDFREVPAVFNQLGNFPVVPNQVNFFLADSVVFVADPFGPIVEGVDIFRKATAETFASLGYSVRFVDVWDILHLYGGAVHCATNVERQPVEKPWWTISSSSGLD